MENIDFSIIIPCYNVERYIKMTIGCVIEQSFKNFEIILINDGSTDETGKILDEYKIKDTRIRVIHKENEGVSKTRNLGIKEAKGKYVYFMDGDDLIEEDLLEKAYFILEDKKVEMFSFGYDVKENTNLKNYNTEKYSQKIFTSKEFLKIFLRKEINQHINYFITDKKILEKVKFESNLITGEDLDFQMKLLLRNDFKVYYDANIYFHYIKRLNSATKKKISLRHLNILFSLEVLRKEMINKNVLEFKNYHIIRFFNIVRSLGKNGYFESEYKEIKNKFKENDYILNDLKLEFNKKSMILNMLKLIYKLDFKLLIFIFKIID